MMRTYRFEAEHGTIEGNKKGAFRAPFASDVCRVCWQITHTLQTKEV